LNFRQTLEFLDGHDRFPTLPIIEINLFAKNDFYNSFFGVEIVAKLLLARLELSEN
jgi:hypothetical protein